MIKKIWYLLEVLQKGKALADPAKWKNRQNLLNTAGGGGGLYLLVEAIVRLLPPEAQVTASDVYQIAEAIAIIGGSFVNWYFTNATSEKVGTTPRS